MAKRKGKVLTMRLDGLLEERVAAMARKKGVSRSQVVRDALEREFLRDEKRKTMSAYDRLKPWIGIYDSSGHPDGPFDAANAKQEFAAYVEEKWRRRNA